MFYHKQGKIFAGFQFCPEFLVKFTVFVDDGIDMPDVIDPQPVIIKFINPEGIFLYDPFDPFFL